MKKIVLFLIMLLSVSALAKVSEVPEPDLNFESAEVIPGDVITMDAFVVLDFKKDPGVEIQKIKTLQDYGPSHELNINLAAEIYSNQAEFKQGNDLVKFNLLTKISKSNFKNIPEDPGWHYLKKYI